MTRPEQPPLDYASPPPIVRPRGGRLKAVLYWVTGNFWLLVALALYVGRAYERSSPTMYSAYGGGQWFTPTEYTLLVMAPASLGIVLTVLAIRQLRNLR